MPGSGERLDPGTGFEFVKRHEDLALEGFAAGDQVPDPLLRIRRDSDGGEHARPVLFGQVDGIGPITFPSLSGADGDEGRSNDIAEVSPFLHGSVEHIPGTARLVATAKLAVTGYPIQKPPEGTGLVEELLDHSGFFGAFGEHRDHHGILVDIHADEDLAGRNGGHGLDLLAGAT